MVTVLEEPPHPVNAKLNVIVLAMPTRHTRAPASERRRVIYITPVRCAYAESVVSGGIEGEGCRVLCFLIFSCPQEEIWTGPILLYLDEIP